jgi:rare lipoprotein A
MRALFPIALPLAAALAACGGARLDARSAPGEAETGLAVYYADSLHGRSTASGEAYDKAALTAAHRELPFGTKVRVTRLDDRRSVVVRINDRGPFGDSRRIIDLSRAAAERIDMLRAGVVEVRVEIVSKPD